MRASPWSVLFLSLTLFGSAAPLVVAQETPSDDEVIDALLASPAVTWAQATWLVGRAVGVLDESVVPEQAVRLAPRTWVPGGMEDQDGVDVAGYSWLLSQALSIRGGVMATLFPGPRYAFRELQYRRILPSSEAPDAPLSGQDALIYLQNAQSWKEGRS